jgi:acyl-CoA dehydrogenase
MALTESHCGSDSSAIRTRAVKDGNSWVLNGEKLFVTSAKKAMIQSEGFMVVWATTNPASGRAGIRPFLVEANTPGVKITRLENKLGLRASDTAVVILEDCRIPLDNMLGGHEGKGFKGAMNTFDSARPAAASSGLGIARATVDFVKEQLAANGIQIRYGVPRNRLTALERDVIEMETQLRAAWLLTLKASWLVDQKKPNTLESSMCKVKAGEVVNRITQKGVELMGSLGYSHKSLLEKWMRDGKIIDVFEGTGQINRLVIARRILGYSSKELK